jgi:ankyrin repeat protein
MDNTTNGVLSGLPTQDELNEQLIKLSYLTQTIDVTVMMDLISAGANVNTKDSIGCTPLMKAAFSNNAAAIHALLTSPNIVVNQENQDGDFVIGDPPLIMAVEYSNPSIVTALLGARNILVNQTSSLGDTALMLAVKLGKVEVVTALLTAPEINVNLANIRNGETALMLAIRGNHTEIVTTLLTHPSITINVNTVGQTALLWAVRNGQIAIVTALLADQDIKINISDDDEKTALMLAAKNGHTAVVTDLLAVDGINVNLADRNGQTALIMAAAFGHTATVEALLAADGINVNLVSHDNDTALILAAAFGHTAMVTALLAVNDINVNLANHDGDTAISIAFENGCPEIVQLLEARGAVLPAHLRQENRAVNNINGRQSVHEVSVHESVSNSAKNLREYYHYTQEEFIENTKTLFDWLSSDFSDTSKLTDEYKPEWLAPARNCVARLNALDFTDQRSNINMQEALAFVWSGINNTRAKGTNEAELSAEEITSRRINFLKNLNEIQREYNLGDGANPQDNGEEDNTTCVSGSFNKLIAALNEVGHVGVQIIFVTQTVITLQVPFLTRQAFGDLSEDNRRRFAQNWENENPEAIQAECFDMLKKLVTHKLQIIYDEFKAEVPKLNQYILEAAANVQHTDMDNVIKKERENILPPPPAFKRRRAEPVVFSCTTRSGGVKRSRAEAVHQPEVRAVLEAPARRNPKRERSFTGCYKV